MFGEPAEDAGVMAVADDDVAQGLGGGLRDGITEGEMVAVVFDMCVDEARQDMFELGGITA